MLYIVGTPIGNPRDMSVRAKEILESVDFIACEDTRQTGLLLKAHGIHAKLMSYHEHNRASREKAILESLRSGKNIALVSDAGMPCISDPGEQLIRLCAAENVAITVIPGPTALASALALSGLDARRFLFEGFLPPEGKERRERLTAVCFSEVTVILYEAPHRLVKTLDELAELHAGSRKVAICRELTKKYEQVIRMTVDEARAYYSQQVPKGEFVLVLEGADRSAGYIEEHDIEKKILELSERGVSIREIASVLSAESGESKNVIYSKALMVLKYRKE